MAQGASTGGGGDVPGAELDSVVSGSVSRGSVSSRSSSSSAPRRVSGSKVSRGSRSSPSSSEDGEFVYDPQRRAFTLSGGRVEAPRSFRPAPRLLSAVGGGWSPSGDRWAAQRAQLSLLRRLAHPHLEELGTLRRKYSRSELRRDSRLLALAGIQHQMVLMLTEVEQEGGPTPPDRDPLPPALREEVRRTLRSHADTLRALRAAGARQSAGPRQGGGSGKPRKPGLQGGECFHCGQRGHFVKECPRRKSSGG
eukprot:Sspe_Gene.22954::Locus_8838_Transcript_1_1_Confidence_1.000_Length_1510::g.22954::m.22954